MYSKNSAFYNYMYSQNSALYNYFALQSSDFYNSIENLHLVPVLYIPVTNS